jgi:glycosyltransferase involved in cell wall biosynthesis
MRIAALVPEGIVNAIYRSLIPMQALAHRGHSVHVEERNEVRDASPLLAFDLVHFVRFCDPPMQRLAQHLRAAGIPMIWDNDDDLVSVARGDGDYRERRGLHGREITRGMETMTTLADVVTTPSPLLAEQYTRTSGRPARVLENYLPPTFTRRQPPANPGQLVVGWLAAGEHRRDLEQLRLRETLQRLLERRPDVRIASIGINLGLRSDRYHHIANVPYGELPNYLGELDVALAPIIDTDFNRARSNVKLKEYAALGVPWLASPTGPYAAMGEQQGGQLVADDGWDDALEGLVRDAGQRTRLGLQGLRWAREQTIERHIDGWEQALEDAVAHAQTRPTGVSG